MKLYETRNDLSANTKSVVIALLNALIQGLQPSVSLQSVVLAVTVVTVIGVFFGLYPASRAAALSPIRALRSE